MKKNRGLMTIFLIIFIDLLGFGIILPLLPYIAEKYQATPLAIGALSAIYSLFQLIAAPILGRLSDRFGRKKMLIVSQLGSAIGYLLLGLAHNLPLLFIARIIDGITGGNISIAQAYIADVTTKENRARGMGLIGAAFGLGFIFGPAIGGVLAKFSYAMPAFFAAAVALITVVTTFLFLPETINTEKAGYSPRRQFNFKELKRVMLIYPIGILIIAFFIIQLASSMHQGIFALWAEKTFQFGVTENGLLFAYVGVLAVLVQLWLLPFLSKRFKERVILDISLLALMTGFLLISFSKDPMFLYFALSFLPVGFGLSGPMIQTITSEDVPKEEYGGTLGILQSAGSLGRILGPVIAGEAFQLTGKDSVYYLAAALILITFIYLKVNIN
jgi:DHA1 family tetracycline resistance protein-like MFS transporter